MRTSAGGIAASVIALFLGVLVVTQFRSQDVYSRSLQLETPASLTTVIANLSDRNNELRNEIFDLRRDLVNAQESVASGREAARTPSGSSRCSAPIAPSRDRGSRYGSTVTSTSGRSRISST